MKPHRVPTTKDGPRLNHSRPSSLANGDVSKLSSPSQMYDVHTGQVFKEIEVHTSKRQSSDWIGEFNTPGLVIKRLPNASGARSLFDMAKGTVARQMKSISSQHLSDIPWEIAEQVWNEITKM
jgi:hypothetical protein